MDRTTETFAARLIRIESAFAEIFHRAAAPVLPPGEIFFERLGSAIVIAERAWSTPVLNRVLALHDGNWDEATLDGAVVLMNRHASKGAAVQVSSHDPSLAAAVIRRGLLPTRASVLRFVRTSDPVDIPTPLGLTIRQLGRDDDAGRFAESVCRIFGLPSMLIPGFAAFARDPAQITFGAFHGARLAAVACLTMVGDDAMLSCAATEEDFRNRGLQRALLAVRIAAAAKRGADLLCVDTHFDDFRTDNVSAGNLRRLGFRVGLELVCHQLSRSAEL